MKILLISSSPRKEKSQTLLLAKKVLNGCGKKTVKSEIIHLCDLKIEFCRHCEGCHRKILACPIKDDVKFILKKMLDADGIILATPNYINHITGSMKTLFDRSSHFIHCKRLLGKFIAGVVSSGSGRDKEVLNYIKYYSHTCGAQYCGGVSCRVPISKEKIQKAAKLGQKLFSDIKTKKEYPTQLKTIEQGKQHFKKIMQKRKSQWQQEYLYWKEKGWL